MKQNKYTLAVDDTFVGNKFVNQQVVIEEVDTGKEVLRVNEYVSKVDASWTPNDSMPLYAIYKEGEAVPYSDMANHLLDRMNGNVSKDDDETVLSPTHLSPWQYAVVVFGLVPFGVAMCIIGAVLLTACWPLMPFVAYYQKKEEIKKLHARQLRKFLGD